MSDSILARYAIKEPAETEATQGEGLENLGFFGFLRGVRDRALMLEARLKDGTSHAFGYQWLDHATFDPSEGITLSFGARTVKLVGRHLGAEVRPNLTLFAAILRHRVPWVREADSMALLQVPADALVIEEIIQETP